MKNTLLAISAGIFLMAGCKEIGPSVTLTATSTSSADTAYVLDTMPTVTDQHNMLVEDFSGQSCPNCPAADTNLDAEALDFPGRMNRIVLFPIGTPQTIPPGGSTHDLESNTATDLENDLTVYNGLVGLPSVGIDRVSVTNSSGIWDVSIANRATVTDSLNMLVQSSYNTTTAMVTTTVCVTYTKPVTYQQNLNVAITEDSIVDIHEEPLGAFDNTYLYMNTFRGFITSGYTGDVINYLGSSNKPQGLYWRKVYSYALPAVYNGGNVSNNPPIVPNHCKVIAFVTNSTNGTVAQSVQTSLTGN